VSYADLLTELQDLTKEIEGLQGRNNPSNNRDIAIRYLDWFGRAVNLVPEDLKKSFRDAYEGGSWTDRLKSFLLDPNRPNPLFDGSKPPGGLNEPLNFSFERTAWPNLMTQQQALIESSHRVPVTHQLGKSIFLVHGHNEARLQEVARLVERTTNTKVVILREQTDQGRTIVEKFEDHASDCRFAIVLLTADDFGRSRTGEDQPRARQNVVFEAGYFIGALGRANVALLKESDVEVPSDLHGVVYIGLADNWQMRLLKEMGAAGIEVDLSRA
jgi:predicted nucleotide-binding protein